MRVKLTENSSLLVSLSLSPLVGQQEAVWLQYSLCTLHCTLYTHAHSLLFTVAVLMFAVHCTWLQSSLSILHFTNMQVALCTAHCTIRCCAICTEFIVDADSPSHTLHWTVFQCLLISWYMKLVGGNGSAKGRQHCYTWALSSLQ